MRVAYRAYDRSGRLVSDAIEAASAAEASELLRRQGLFATELSESKDASSPAAPSQRAGGFVSTGRTRRLKDMAAFVRQLSILVATGTPMIDAISSLERQISPGPWRNAVADIRLRIEQGSSLSAALDHHPTYFDAVARSLIAAGESGGKLDSMLVRLSVLSRQQVKTRAMIAGAMVYPCLLICVAISVLITLLIFVLPRFEGLFENLGSPLPPTTRMLVDLSHFLRDQWYIALGVVIAAVVCAKLGITSQKGRTFIARASIRLPHFGPVLRTFAVARFARVLGVLVEARVPLLEALRLTRESSGHLSYAELLTKVEDRVTRGESISATLENSPLIDNNIVEAIRSGERSGQLGPVLISIADFLDEDNEVILKSLSSVIEPLILIVLGTLIGFVAVSMFLPLFDLASATGGGGQ